MKINPQKTQRTTSTNGESAVGAIKLECGKATTDRLKMAIKTYSIKAVNGGDPMIEDAQWHVEEAKFEPSESASLQAPESDATQEPSTPVETTDGLRL